MTINLNSEVLHEIGFEDLTSDDEDELLQHLYDELESRVGMRIAGAMSDEQLQQFEAAIEANDKTAALDWLAREFPAYSEVVAAELDLLKAEWRHRVALERALPRAT